MGTRPRPPAQYPPAATNAVGRDLGEAARREVLAFPAEYLGDLPVPVKVELVGAGLGAALGAGTVMLVCRRLAQTEPAMPMPAVPIKRTAAVVFDADELRAIAVGVQSERLRPADFRAFCLRKRLEPGFRVTEEASLDGARAEPRRPGSHPWSLDRVLRWLELDLTALEYLGTGPVVADAARAA